MRDNIASRHKKCRQLYTMTLLDWPKHVIPKGYALRSNAQMRHSLSIPTVKHICITERPHFHHGESVGPHSKFDRSKMCSDRVFLVRSKMARKIISQTLKLHSQTRNKKLVELLHEFHLGVSYKRVHSIETSYVRVTGTKAKANGDVICPTNLRYDIFSVATLGNKIIIRGPCHVTPVGRRLITKPTKTQPLTLDSFDDEKRAEQ